MDHSQHHGHNGHHMDHTTDSPMDQTTHDHSMHQMHDHSTHHRAHESHESHNVFFTTNFHGQVLFESFDISSNTGIFMVILMAIIIGIFYEGIKIMRQYIHRDVNIAQVTIKSREHLLQTVLYLIQFIGSYILMLIVMTYNVWVLLATLAGLGLGHFLCAWKVGNREWTMSSGCAGECKHPILKKDSEPELEPLREGMEMNCDTKDDVRETNM